MLSRLKEVFSNSIEILETNKANLKKHIYIDTTVVQLNMCDLLFPASPQKSLSKIVASGAQRICAGYAICFLPQLAAPSFLLLPSS